MRKSSADARWRDNNRSSLWHAGKNNSFWYIVHVYSYCSSASNSFNLDYLCFNTSLENNNTKNSALFIDSSSGFYQRSQGSSSINSMLLRICQMRLKRKARAVFFVPFVKNPETLRVLALGLDAAEAEISSFYRNSCLPVLPPLPSGIKKSAPLYD